MKAVLPLSLALLIAGCGTSGDKAQKISCNSSPNLNGKDTARKSSEWQRLAALYAIRDLREVRQLARTTWFGTGAFSTGLGSFKGTAAHRFKEKVRHLQAQVADIKAVDFAMELGGKSPLPANASWACKMLAVSVGNLDTGQSDKQFLKMTDFLEDYLLRKYEASGGRNLNNDLMALSQTGSIE